VGLSRHAVARGAAGGGRGAEDDEQDGGREDEDETAGAARHSWRHYCLLLLDFFLVQPSFAGKILDMHSTVVDQWCICIYI